MEKSIKDRLIAGGFWVFGGRIFSLISQLAVNAILARILTPNDMGFYFLILSIVNFFMRFSLLGMQRSIVRIVAESLALEKNERANQAVRNMLQLGLITSITLALILVLGAGKFVAEHVFKAASMGEMVYLPAIWLILYSLQTLMAEAFRGYHDIRGATIFNGLISSSFNAIVFCAILFFYKQSNLQVVLQIIVASHAINFLLAFYFLRMHTGKLITVDNGKMSSSELFKDSWMLYFTDLFLFVMTSGHLWLLACFSAKESVAIFGAVSRLMAIVTTTLVMLRFTIAPTIGHLYAKRQFVEVENVLRLSATIAGLPALMGLLLIILMGKQILFVMYGSHYIIGYHALVILAGAHLINVFTGTPALLMLMASQEKYLLIFALISGAIGMVISVLLVKPLEYIGVSIGAGIGIVQYNLLMVWFCQKRLSTNTLMRVQDFLKIIQKIRQFSLPDIYLGGFRNLFK